MITPRVEKLLAKEKRTFYWLAKETGIGHTSLWRLRHEVSKGISFDFLERICRALECEPGELFELIDDARTIARARKAGTRKSRR